MRSSQGISSILRTFGTPLVLCLPLSRAIILVYTQNETAVQLARKFTDLPAADGFGPRIPERGFKGRLQLAKPDIYACSRLHGPIVGSKAPGNDTSDPGIPRSLEGSHGPHGGHADGDHSRNGGYDGDYSDHFGEDGQSIDTETTYLDSSDVMPIAVLVSRSLRHDPHRCTFEEKVLHAQRAGYGLVVVYDFEQGSLFKMGASSNRNIEHSAVNIPLVLVAHETGLDLEKLIAECDDARGPEVFVDGQDPYMKMFAAVNFTMLMVICGFFLALVTCGTMMIITVHRYLRRYEELVGNSMRLMPLPEVLQLPEVLVEATSKLVGDPCPVCLDLYRIGDKLRGLPCGHSFHGPCITPWLTEGQRCCPICKERVEIKPTPTPPASTTSVASRGLSSAVSADSLGAQVPPASSPLLRPRWDESTAGSSSVLPSLSSPILIALTSRTNDREPNETSEAERGRNAGRGGDRLPLLLNSRGPSSDGGSIQNSRV